MSEISDEDLEKLKKDKVFRKYWELCNPVLTREDRRLQKKVADAYSEEVVELWIFEKDNFEKEDWPKYKKGVLELLERNLPEERFIEEVRRLNELALVIL